MSQPINKSDYYEDVKRYISDLGYYQFVSETGGKEGNKYMSMRDVGGRFYKKYVFECTNPMDDVEERDMESELRTQIKNDTNFMQQKSPLNSKYFIKSDIEEKCIVHAGCEDKDKKTVWVKPHIIPNPE